MHEIYCLLLSCFILEIHLCTHLSFCSSLSRPLFFFIFPFFISHIYLFLLEFPDQWVAPVHQRIFVVHVLFTFFCCIVCVNSFAGYRMHHFNSIGYYINAYTVYVLFHIFLQIQYTPITWFILPITWFQFFLYFFLFFAAKTFNEYLSEE